MANHNAPTHELTHFFRNREDRERIPRILIRAIMSLCLIILGIVSLARIMGMEPAAMPPKDIPVVAERTLIIYGDRDGNARVLDQHGSQIADLSPQQGGFISGVWRSMARARTQQGIDPNAPVRIVKFADGRLALRDDQSGWRAELIGFGRDNTRAFATLLEQ
ncbi:MAG: photosynthetic complex assembly protein PuhC [Paracoccaceae bacterium]